MKNLSTAEHIRYHKAESGIWLDLFNQAVNGSLAMRKIDQRYGLVYFIMQPTSPEKSEIFQHYCQSMCEFHSHQMHLLATATPSPSKTENEPTTQP